jgi:tetratricopeptide (TPR) repeat protein
MDIEAMYDQAMQDIEAGHNAAAQRRLAQVLQADPEHEEAWQALALIVPDMDQAIECLNRVLELNPHNTEALNYLTLAREIKRRGAADDPLLTTATSIGPTAGEADGLPRLGRLLLEAKFITPAQLEAALAAQLAAASAGKPQRLGELLVEKGAISPAQLGFVVRDQRQRLSEIFWD